MMELSVEVRSVARRVERLERRAIRIANWLLDLIFPPTCGHCGRVDFRFCPGCLRELEQVAVAGFSRAQDVGPELDAITATGKHQAILQNAVQAFKYDGARDLAKPLAKRLATALRRTNWQFDVIVPVPLFADREAERGYNQATLLSQQMVAAAGVRSRPECLRRVRKTDQQALLSQADRRENVRQAFVASEDVSGLSILLVDDVITTGSTLLECAIALRVKGAVAVYAIAVSHA